MSGKMTLSTRATSTKSLRSTRRISTSGSTPSRRQQNVRPSCRSDTPSPSNKLPSKKMSKVLHLASDSGKASADSLSSPEAKGRSSAMTSKVRGASCADAQSSGHASAAPNPKSKTTVSGISPSPEVMRQSGRKRKLTWKMMEAADSDKPTSSGSPKRAKTETCIEFSVKLESVSGCEDNFDANEEVELLDSSTLSHDSPIPVQVSDQYQTSNLATNNGQSSQENVSVSDLLNSVKTEDISPEPPEDSDEEFSPENSELVAKKERRSSSIKGPVQCEECGLILASKYILKNHALIHSGGRPFQCEKCGKAFKLKHDLTVHLRSHSGELPYICPTCGSAFISSTALRRHKVVEHDKVRYGCDSCDKKYSSRVALNAHILGHKGEKPYSCEQCEKRFAQKSNLMTHVRRVHEKHRPFACSVCLYKCADKIGLQQHMNKHTGNREFQCSLCPKAFTFRTNLYKHMKQHESGSLDNASHKCGVCSEEFSTNSLLKLHKQEVHSGKTYKCPECELVFKSQLSFDEHMQEAHNLVLTCATCSRTFKSKLSYDRHMKSHSVETMADGVKSFQCQECDASFLRAADYLRHQKKAHEAKEEHLCPVCGGSFASRRNLEYHVLTHTGVKPYKCDKCEKSFSHPNNLRFHQQTHTDKKPHQCEKCQRSFALRSYLKAHMLKHTDSKFPCNVCTRVLSTADNLKLHMRVHFNERPFLCGECGRRYVSKRDLNSHVKQSHSRKTSSEPVECDVCGKRLKTLAILAVHRKLHERDKTFRCTTCHTYFALEEELGFHMNSHAREKPFQCSVCFSRFSHKSHLLNHVIKHTGQKPFTCDQCSRSYSSRGALHVHKKTHSQDRPHKCHLCARGFRQRHHLQTHMKIHDKNPAMIQLNVEGAAIEEVYTEEAAAGDQYIFVDDQNQVIAVHPISSTSVVEGSNQNEVCVVYVDENNQIIQSEEMSSANAVFSSTSTPIEAVASGNVSSDVDTSQGVDNQVNASAEVDNKDGVKTEDHDYVSNIGVSEEGVVSQIIYMEDNTVVSDPGLENHEEVIIYLKSEEDTGGENLNVMGTSEPSTGQQDYDTFSELPPGGSDSQPDIHVIQATAMPGSQEVEVQQQGSTLPPVAEQQHEVLSEMATVDENIVYVTSGEQKVEAPPSLEGGDQDDSAETAGDDNDGHDADDDYVETSVVYEESDVTTRYIDTAGNVYTSDGNQYNLVETEVAVTSDSIDAETAESQDNIPASTNIGTETVSEVVDMNPSLVQANMTSSSLEPNILIFSAGDERAPDSGGGDQQVFYTISQPGTVDEGTSSQQAVQTNGHVIQGDENIIQIITDGEAINGEQELIEQVIANNELNMPGSHEQVMVTQYDSASDEKVIEMNADSGVMYMQEVMTMPDSEQEVVYYTFPDSQISNDANIDETTLVTQIGLDESNQVLDLKDGDGFVSQNPEQLVMQDDGANGEEVYWILTESVNDDGETSAVKTEDKHSLNQLMDPPTVQLTDTLTTSQANDPSQLLSAVDENGQIVLLARADENSSGDHFAGVTAAGSSDPSVTTSVSTSMPQPDCIELPPSSVDSTISTSIVSKTLTGSDGTHENVILLMSNAVNDGAFQPTSGEDDAISLVNNSTIETSILTSASGGMIATGVHESDERSACASEVVMPTAPEPMVLYQCGTCDSLFSSVKKLHTHMESHVTSTLPESEPDNIPQCDVIPAEENVEVGTASGVDDSDKLYTGVSGDILAEVDNRIVVEEEGILSGEQQQVFGCLYCDSEFPSQWGLTQHVMNHRHLKPPFICNICHRVLATKSNLILHMRVHAGIRPFKCKLCAKSFVASRDLISHMKQRHVESDVQHQCETCGNVFKTLRTLQVHKKLHERAKQFGCRSCHEKFATQDELILHMDVHAAEKPYQCMTCFSRFKEVRAAVEHGRLHTGDKPFKCGHCPKSFSQRSSLASHVRLHSSLRPYKCGVCSKGFKLMSHLSTHLKIHSQPERFERIEPQACDLEEEIGELTTSVLLLHNNPDLGEGIKLEPLALDNNDRIAEDCHNLIETAIDSLDQPDQTEVLTTTHESVGTKSDDVVVPDSADNPDTVTVAVPDSDSTGLTRNDDLISQEGAQANVGTCVYDEDLDAILNQINGITTPSQNNLSVPLQESQVVNADIKRDDDVVPTELSQASKSMEESTGGEPNVVVLMESSQGSKSMEESKGQVPNVSALPERGHAVLFKQGPPRRARRLASKRLARFRQETAGFPEIQQCVVKIERCIDAELLLRPAIQPPIAKSVAAAESVTSTDIGDDVMLETGTDINPPELLSKPLPVRDEKSETVNTPVVAIPCSKSDAGGVKSFDSSVVGDGQENTEKDAAFKCSACPSSFDSLDELLQHVTVHKSTKPFVCEYCGQLYKSKYTLEIHVRKHTGENPFMCEICARSFRSQAFLRDHMLTHVADKPFKCEHCPKSFVKKSMLTAHTRVHTGDKIYKCTLCDCSFCSKSNLNAHITRKHDPNLSFACTQCDKKFPFGYELQKHINKIHEKVKFHCEMCGRSYKEKTCYRRHKKICDTKTLKCFMCGEVCKDASVLDAHLSWAHKIVLADDEMRCTECGDKFNDTLNLDEHLKNAHQIEPLLCSECQSIFANGESLSRHRERSHNIFHCFSCDIGFETKTEMKTHMEIHVNNSCPHCQRSFKHEKSLKAHLLAVHSIGTPPYKCTICQHGYWTQRNLNDHMNKHTGERPYKCTKCPKDFTNQSNLLKHTKSHDPLYDPQPKAKHPCPVCGKEFSSKTNMESHVKRIHEQLKLHQCEICSHSFASRVTMMEHMNTHYGEKPYQCQDCGYASSSKSNYHKHMKLHHGLVGSTTVETVTSNLAANVITEIVDGEHLTQNVQVTSFDNEAEILKPDVLVDVAVDRVKIPLQVIATN